MHVHCSDARPNKKSSTKKLNQSFLFCLPGLFLSAGPQWFLCHRGSGRGSTPLCSWFVTLHSWITTLCRGVFLVGLSILLQYLPQLSVHVQLFWILYRLPLSMHMFLGKTTDGPLLRKFIVGGWALGMGGGVMLHRGIKKHHLSQLQVNLNVVLWKMQPCIAKVEQ